MHSQYEFETPSTAWFGKEEQNVTRYCVHDEGFTEYGVIQSLMLSWGILFYISSYLSALNSLCRIQQRPWMMGHVVPGMYALPQPVQRSRSFQASPRGHAQFPCLLNQREHPREEPHLTLHSDASCPSFTPSHLYKRPQGYQLCRYNTID